MTIKGKEDVIMESNAEVAQAEPIGPTIAVLRAQYLWWALVGASLLMAATIYVPAMKMWWGAWWMEDSLYSHGVLVPPIAAFIIYLDRERLSKITISPNLLLGSAAMLLVALASFVSRGWGSALVEGFTLPLFLIAASLLLLGKQMTRPLLFPLLFLMFMCPLPESLLAGINIKIQILSTVVATNILALAQFDPMREGTTILMPNITVRVGAPCSGFRMLISLFAFSSFFAYMKEGPLWGRIGIVLSALPLSLVTNSVRVVLIALAGEMYGESVMHAFHDWSGYIMLVVSFVALEFLSRVLRCRRFRSMQ